MRVKQGHMLELKDIKKDYSIAGGAVHALNGVSIKFRKNEFVSVLGASGCGKTTLLNIIGGLDKYTSGDLIINGVSTKCYKDGDWDTYRNHSVGFIFQSYHLIPHQTILQNVELALTISGVSEEERRARAVEALEKVGLANKMKNRPNQLSGGQAQRVAIARALVNDPEIVLADEPTGALDSKTSVQIMELLKEISKERLVIMVTHNPELAEKYSTRIIRLFDGIVTDDSAPYDGEDEESVKTPAAEEGKKVKKGKKKASMSFGMAFALSLKNLLSKGKRTAMVSVAGSIGIIGVSLVLAISSGVQLYIRSMEDDMLSGYPLSVTETAVDINALMNVASTNGMKAELDRLDDKIYVDGLLDRLMAFADPMKTNDINEDYYSFVQSMPSEYYNALQYGYDFEMSNYIYTDFSVDGTSENTQNVSVTGIRAKYTSVLSQEESYGDLAPMISTLRSFREIPDNPSYILSQYDILATYNGKTANLTQNEIKDIFENKESLIMVVSDNGFADLNFGQYGYMTEDEFLNFAYKAEGSQDYDKEVTDKYENGLSFDTFIGDNAHSFKWYPNDTVYKEGEAGRTILINGIPLKSSEYEYLEDAAEFAPDRDKSDDLNLKVKIILQKKKNISYGCLSSGLYYTNELTKHTLKAGLESNISKHIAGNGDLSILHYSYDFKYPNDDKEYISGAAASYISKASGGMMSMAGMAGMGGGISGFMDSLKASAGMVAGTSLPSAFYIYPINFDSKDLVTKYLDKWNAACEVEGGGELKWTDTDGVEHSVILKEENKIEYTDAVGLIITMVNTMIEMITIALVAFTALSLVVSTVMVGIITYVSVVERIKEIGILRACGARKKDIKWLFNAETFIIGFAAGLVGIAVTYLLSLILNLVLGTLFGIYTIASLPWWQAIVMVVISVVLTLISGLIPASAAAKKDPVVALRTE